MSPAFAAPFIQSSRPVPTIAARSSTSIAPCAEAAAVPRRQVRCVRDAHLSITSLSRASSRFSAPNALTTALQETASASAPPIRVSQALARLAAGAT